MNAIPEPLIHALAIGVGATALLDLCALLLKHTLGLPGPNWAMVGRWFAHMPRGRFVHERITAAEPVRGERALGWAAHYVIGVLYAAVLLWLWGPAWAREPTLAPAMIVSLVGLAAPFLLMQPGMGAGVAASRTPRPNVARLQSVAAHGVFGIGMYVSALLLPA